MIPVQLGSDDSFSRVRHALIDAGYTEEELCRRLGIEKLADFERDPSREQREPYEDSTLGVLVRLFVEGRYLELRLAEERIGSQTLQAMSDLGLKRRDEDQPDVLFSPISLYPSNDLYILSDRWSTPDGSPYHPEADIVYPAIVSNAQRFLNLMPRRRCDTVLDLCAGTGVAALLAAKSFGKRAWSADITERATVYAEFNRRLNEISNVTTVQGDLYEPVSGMTFDRIVAHPPYVPVLRPKFVYHDGGQDGEQLMRRIVAQLDQYLRPGGLFYMLATGHDHEGEPLEIRVRQWLGEAQAEFDVAIVVINTMSPEDFAAMAAIKSKTPQRDLEEFKRLFHQLEVTSMVYSVIMIQRRAEPRGVFTVRRSQGEVSGREHFERLLDWETLAVSNGGLRKILDSRIRTHQQSELRVVHRLGHDGWEVTEHILRSTSPFSMEARTDPWAPYMMAFCDGTKTIRQHLDELKGQQVVPENTPPEEFARAVAVLVSGGFLSVEE